MVSLKIGHGAKLHVKVMYFKFLPECFPFLLTMFILKIWCDSLTEMILRIQRISKFWRTRFEIVLIALEVKKQNI